MTIKLSLDTKRAFGFTAVAAVLVAGAVASAAKADNGSPISLDPGTLIPVTLNTELSSNNSQPGDTFTATVDTSRAMYGKIMQGAIVDGKVVTATPRSGSDAGQLDLKFTQLRLADGSSYQLTGVPGSLNTKDYTTNADGLLVANNTKKDQHLTYAGYGAGAGALLGVLSGGKLDIGKTLIGGGLGYALGSLLKGPTQVHDVDLKPGTSMAVLLKTPVRYYHHTQPTSYTGANGTTATGTTGQTSATTQPTQTAPTTADTSNRRYYWYQGQQYYIDAATGERGLVQAAAPTTSRKYYDYNGHHYFVDLNTGERVQLD